MCFSPPPLFFKGRGGEGRGGEGSEGFLLGLFLFYVIVVTIISQSTLSRMSGSVSENYPRDRTTDGYANRCVVVLLNRLAYEVLRTSLDCVRYSVFGIYSV